MQKNKLIILSTLLITTTSWYWYQTMNAEPNRTMKTESGLEYIIQKEAPEGAKSPTKGKVVTVHYTGWLPENVDTDNFFDSSKKPGRGPFQFVIGVGQVIKGWDEGVATMKVGEKRRLILPSELGYGSRGAGASIPPNSTLVFDVELLDVA